MKGAEHSAKEKFIGALDLTLSRTELISIYKPHEIWSCLIYFGQCWFFRQAQEHYQFLYNTWAFVSQSWPHRQRTKAKQSVPLAKTNIHLHLLMPGITAGPWGMQKCTATAPPNLTFDFTERCLNITEISREYQKWFLELVVSWDGLAGTVGHKQRGMQPQLCRLPSLSCLTEMMKACSWQLQGTRAVSPGDLPHLPQPFLPLTHHKNFLLFVFMSLTLCSSNSLSGSSVSFSQCPLWSVPLSLGFTSVGFPVSDSHSFCSNNLLNSVFKHMDSFAFLLLFSKGAVPICTDRLWGA